MAVNVHTEWGKLKEIIVGSCFNLTHHNIDLSFKLMFNDNIRDIFLKNSYSLQERLIEQREQDLDNYQKTLEEFGVKVFRPRKLEKIKEFQTPEFKGYTYPVTNPRDLTLVIGNEIIETPVMHKTRFFENDLLKEVFLDYFRRGAKWTSAPRPSLADSAYDLSYVKRNEGQYTHWREHQCFPHLYEIMFDGANCLKFGKHIVMNVANENHELGYKWLSRHLEGTFEIHKVSIADHHIDGMFMPLRPGTLLINPESMASKIDLLPEPLKKWDKIIVPEPDKSILSNDHLPLASPNIPVNVLSIDEKKVIVFDSGNGESNALIKILEKNNFEPVPILLRHSRLFGGGAHCATLDMVRDDSPEDFFS